MATQTTTKTGTKATSKTQQRHEQILRDQELFKWMPDLPATLVGTKRINAVGAVSLLREALASGEISSVMFAIADFLEHIAVIFPDQSGFVEWVNGLDDDHLYEAPVRLAEKVMAIVGEPTPSAD